MSGSVTRRTPVLVAVGVVLALVAAAIVHARADLTRGPRAARRYRNLLPEAGFGEVTVEVHTGVFTGPTMLPFAGRAGRRGPLVRRRHA